jgi:heptosyltransferase-2
LIIAPNWVGDSIFMLPAVSALRRHFKDFQFTLLAKPQIAELHAASPLFDVIEKIEGEGREGRFASHWRLRKRNFDLAIVFPPSFSSAFASWLSGAKKSLGRGGQGRNIFLTSTGPMPAADRQRHVSEEYLDLARLAGAQPSDEDRAVKLKLTHKGQEERDRLFAEHSLEGNASVLALCPTSAYCPSK